MRGELKILERKYPLLAILCQRTQEIEMHCQGIMLRASEWPLVFLSRRREKLLHCGSLQWDQKQLGWFVKVEFFPTVLKLGGHRF